MDAVIFVVDYSSPAQMAQAEDELLRLLATDFWGLPLAIALNKADLHWKVDENSPHFETSLLDRFSVDKYRAECCATTGAGLQKIVDWLVRATEQPTPCELVRPFMWPSTAWEWSSESHSTRLQTWFLPRDFRERVLATVAALGARQLLCAALLEAVSAELATHLIVDCTFYRPHAEAVGWMLPPINHEQ